MQIWWWDCRGNHSNWLHFLCCQAFEAPPFCCQWRKGRRCRTLGRRWCTAAVAGAARRRNSRRARGPTPPTTPPLPSWGPWENKSSQNQVNTLKKKKHAQQCVHAIQAREIEETMRYRLLKTACSYPKAAQICMHTKKNDETTHAFIFSKIWSRVFPSVIPRYEKNMAVKRKWQRKWIR